MSIGNTGSMRLSHVFPIEIVIYTVFIGRTIFQRQNRYDKMITMECNMQIKQIKKNARALVKTQQKAVTLLSIVWTTLYFLTLVVALPIVTKLLVNEAAITNTAYHTTKVIAYPMWLMIAVFIVGSVLIKSLIIDVLNNNMSINYSLSTISNFMSMFVSTAFYMIIVRMVVILSGFIPLFGASYMYVHQMDTWPQLTVLSFIYVIVMLIVVNIVYAFAPIMTVTKLYSAQQSLTESRHVIHSHKWHYFKLMASFIPLDIVNVLTLGLFAIYLMPYKIAVKLEYGKVIAK